jgi:hypothetical protein
MLTQALSYGYHEDEWWSTISDLEERLLVSSALLGKENEVIAGRVLGLLLSDPDLLNAVKGLPKSVVTGLLAIGTKTSDPVLRQKIFVGLRTLIRPSQTWKDPPIEPDQIKRLGVLAMEDSEAGDTTAELIGHLRSPSAIKVVLKHLDEERKIAALMLVQQVADSLPPFVPAHVRLRLSLEGILQRLTQRPIQLLAAFVTFSILHAFRPPWNKD